MVSALPFAGYGKPMRVTFMRLRTPGGGCSARIGSAVNRRNGLL